MMHQSKNIALPWSLIQRWCRELSQVIDQLNLLPDDDERTDALYYRALVLLNQLSFSPTDAVDEKKTALILALVDAIRTSQIRFTVGPTQIRSKLGQICARCYQILHATIFMSYLGVLPPHILDNIKRVSHDLDFRFDLAFAFVEIKPPLPSFTRHIESLSSNPIPDSSELSVPSLKHLNANQDCTLNIQIGSFRVIGVADGVSNPESNLAASVLLNVVAGALQDDLNQDDIDPYDIPFTLQSAIQDGYEEVKALKPREYTTAAIAIVWYADGIYHVVSGCQGDSPIYVRSGTTSYSLTPSLKPEDTREGYVKLSEQLSSLRSTNNDNLTDSHTKTLPSGHTVSYTVPVVWSVEDIAIFNQSQPPNSGNVGLPHISCCYATFPGNQFFCLAGLTDGWSDNNRLRGADNSLARFNHMAALAEQSALLPINYAPLLIWPTVYWQATEFRRSNISPSDFNVKPDDISGVCLVYYPIRN